MKLDVLKLDGGKAGSVDLDEALFGLEPRADILHRVVRWQHNNAQAGTHKVKTRSEVKYSTKKIYRQKGTGGARHGAQVLVKRYRLVGAPSWPAWRHLHRVGWQRSGAGELLHVVCHGRS